MRALSIINEIPANKAGIKLFADAIVTAVMDGNADPLDVRIRIDSIEKIIKAVKDDVSYKDATLDQADLWPEKTFEKDGVKFTKAESAKYDYSDDPTWLLLKEREGQAAQDRKDLEAVLKALKEPTEINGVMSYPPSKKATTYVKLTF